MEQYFTPFYYPVILLCTEYVYSFISWWTFGLFPLFDYYEYCCYKHSRKSFCVDIIFSFLLDINLGVVLYGDCFKLWEFATLFSK